ncbi:MAG: hypothetical protein ACOYL6_09245 [Bacteriovoracaceae bacterium]
MKFLAVLMILGSVAIHAEEMNLGPKADFNQLEKDTKYNRGVQPSQGRGPASVGTTMESVKKDEISGKGFHINKSSHTYQDALIQPKY